MPRGDRTGPWGLGPLTGRGAGFCAGFPVPGFLNRGWFGPRPFWGWWGWGRGWRHRFWATGVPGWAWWTGLARWFWPGAAPSGPASTGSEKQFLQEQVSFLEKQLDEMKKRLSELEEEK